MTLSVALTPEQKAKLNSLADARGVSLDGLMEDVVRAFAETDLAAAAKKQQALDPKERVKQLEDFFEAVDSLEGPGGVQEGAFHRRNWY